MKILRSELILIYQAVENCKSVVFFSNLRHVTIDNVQHCHPLIRFLSVDHLV